MFVKKAALVASVAALVAGPVGAMDYEGDQNFVGNKDILAGDTVKGNVTIRNGTLTVWGTVEGNITQWGSGGVIVDGADGEGLVKGNIKERDDDSVDVYNGGIVEGNIDERGSGEESGDVNLFGGEDVNGFCIDGEESLVKGNIFERGTGDVFVGCSTVEGNIEERDVGNVDLENFGFVKGNVCERGDGEVEVDNTSTIDGNIDC